MLTAWKIDRIELAISTSKSLLSAESTPLAAYIHDSMAAAKIASGNTMLNIGQIMMKRVIGSFARISIRSVCTWISVSPGSRPPSSRSSASC